MIRPQAMTGAVWVDHTPPRIRGADDVRLVSKASYAGAGIIRSALTLVLLGSSGPHIGSVGVDGRVLVWRD
jgi:hypothetical protein